MAARLDRKTLLIAVVVALLLCSGYADAKKKKSPGVKKPNRKPKPSNKPSKREPTVKIIDAATANALLELKNTTFLDIRKDTAFMESHIAGAVNIPQSLVRQAINTGRPSPPPTKKDILCYATPVAGGKPSTASELAVATCTYFATSGKYPDIKLYALAGGFPNWQAANLPVE